MRDKISRFISERITNLGILAEESAHTSLVKNPTIKGGGICGHKNMRNCWHRRALTDPKLFFGREMRNLRRDMDSPYAPISWM